MGLILLVEQESFLKTSRIINTIIIEPSCIMQIMQLHIANFTSFAGSVEAFEFENWNKALPSASIFNEKSGLAIVSAKAFFGMMQAEKICFS